jgi:hypothetical protein
MPAEVSASPPARKVSFVARHLDLSERLGEILFGLIMVLTFTLGAGLVIEEGADATREMLIAILGCNIAWGIIDGGMYILGVLFDRGRSARLLRSVQQARSDDDALTLIRDELDPRLAPIASQEALPGLYRDILGKLRRAGPLPTGLRKEDLYAAIAVFWLVFLSTIPAVVPFLIFDNRYVALRVSNGLLLAMLFFLGHRWGRATSQGPWKVGFYLLLAGIVLVGTAMALGG